MNDEYLIHGTTLEALANAIRDVSNDTTKRDPHEMAAYILANFVKPTTRQAAKTYTPSTSNQTIAAGTYLTGKATIAGDADLVAANIIKGKNIFNVAGTASGIWGTPDSFYGFTKVASGSFTLNSTITSETHTITHNLGVLPRLVFYYTDATVSSILNYDMYNVIMGMAFATTSESETHKSGSYYGLSSGVYYQFTAYKKSQTYPLYAQYYATASDSYRNGYNNVLLKTMYADTDVYTNIYDMGTIFSCTSSTFTLKIGREYTDDFTEQTEIFNGFGTKTWKWIAMG